MKLKIWKAKDYRTNIELYFTSRRKACESVSCDNQHIEHESVTSYIFDDTLPEDEQLIGFVSSVFVW